MPFVSKKKLNKMIEQLIRSTELLGKQERLIKSLNKEVKHYQNLIGLYEACLKHGTKIDFPDVTGRVKGGYDNTVNNNYFD